MKTVVLFLLIFSASAAKSQTLKELLYNNKLKKDSSGVIRKTDDLKSKIDTSQKKSELEKQKPAGTTTPNTDKGTPDLKSTTTASDTNNAIAPVAITPANTTVKSNTKIWKAYTDSLAISLKTELLNSKKIKKDTYYFTVEYEIGSNGATNVTNVVMTPENSFLISHVQQKLSDSPPQLTPVLNSAGQPQKVKRKHNFVVTKE